MNVPIENSNFRTILFLVIKLTRRNSNEKWIDSKRFQRVSISIKDWTLFFESSTTSISDVHRLLFCSPSGYSDTSNFFCPHSRNANIGKKNGSKSSNKALCGVLAIICLLAFIPYYKLVTKRLMEKVSKHRVEDNFKDAVGHNRLVFPLTLSQQIADLNRKLRSA